MRQNFALHLHSRAFPGAPHASLQKQTNKKIKIIKKTRSTSVTVYTAATQSAAPRTPCWLRLHPEWRMQPTSGGCNPEGNGDQSWEMCFTFKTICYTGFNSLRLASISHRSFLCPIFHLSIFEEESCLLNQLLKTD